MDEDEVLLGSLKLNAGKPALAFPRLRPVPGKSASCFLRRASLFVLRTADQPQGQDAAECQ
jgi:hypothetical protein